MIRALHRLRDDARGNTIIEFAIIAPVMMMLLMGLGDLLYQTYAQAILNGAVQKAARDSGIEGGSTNSTTIDGRVEIAVKKMAKNATFTTTRKSYDSFTKVAPERFTDADRDGVYDAGECFVDQNGNRTWDADPGRTGQGGASAITLYTVVATYPRLFPVARIFGASANQTITAKTLLKNQPYASQVTTADVPVNCPQP